MYVILTLLLCLLFDVRLSHLINITCIVLGRTLYKWRPNPAFDSDLTASHAAVAVRSIATDYRMQIACACLWVCCS